MNKQQTIDMVLGGLLDWATMIVEDGPMQVGDVAFQMAESVLEIRQLIEKQGFPIPTAWRTSGRESVETIDMVLCGLIDRATMIVEDGPKQADDDYYEQDVAFDLADSVLEIRELIGKGFPIPTAWRTSGPE